MKKVVVVLVVLGLAGGGGWWYWRHTATQPTSFRTAAVERGDLQASVNATGTVEPEEVVDVGAQVAGQITSFGRDPRAGTRPIDYGSPVEEGTVLADIDDALYKAQVDQAQANVGRAEADLLQLKAKLTLAERQWQRARDLLAQRAISQDDYDVALAEYDTAKSGLGVGEAAIAQAKAMLGQAKVNLGYCVVRSPVKGVIVDRRVNIGQTVVSSLSAPSLFLIAKDLKRMQIWASVNEADVGNVHAGQPVTFTADAYPGQVFHGTVAADQPRLNASMNQNVVTYTVVVETDNSDGKLLPYLTANLQFEVSRRTGVLLVPNAALRWRPAPTQVVEDARAEYARALAQENGPAAKGGRREQGVIWVNDNGLARPLKVTVGLSDGLHTEVSGAGVKEGLPIIIGESSQAAGGDMSSPFTPQMLGNKKQQQ